MASHLSKHLRKMTKAVPSYACHRVGASESITVQISPCTPRMYTPTPQCTALLNSLSDCTLSRLEAQFEAFAAKMGSSGLSQHFATLEDFLSAVPELQRQQSADAAAADPWPAQVDIQPVPERHRGYSSLAAALQLPQLTCVRAAQSFSAGDAIGPYYSLVMPTDMHDVLYQAADDAKLTKQQVCVEIGTQRITFDASCCVEGGCNKLASLLDYRCITPAGVHNAKRDVAGGANAAFLSYVDRVGRPWLFVVALKSIAEGEEICVEYCKNVEALCSHQHHQHMGKKQLLVQLGPNMQRLQSAMSEVQGAIAGILLQQQLLPPPPGLLLNKPPQQLKSQLSSDQQEMQQQLLIAAVHATPAAAPQQQLPFAQQLNTQQHTGQMQMQAKPAKPGPLRPGYVELLNQQAGSKRYAGPGSPYTLYGKQQRDEATRLQQQPCWMNEQLLASLLNISLQVSQLQELVPTSATGSDSLFEAAAAAQISSSPTAAYADRSASAGGGFCSTSSEAQATEELPHLVLQLIDASSAEVKLQALEALERLAAEPCNAHCLATLGVVPKLTGFLAGSGAAEQTAAAGILRHLAAGNTAQKEALVAAGAITALVRVLCSGATEEARAHAAAALSGIAAGSSMHRKGITATRCAVSGLICLLSSQLPAAVEAAAAALKNLTASETGRRAISTAPNGISLLAAVLTRGNMTAKQWAAGALSNLAADSAANQQAIAAAPGAISSLVQMLSSSNEMVQKPAAAAIANLTAGSAENKAAVAATHGAVSGLVWLLGSQNPSLQTIAAAALGDLCAGNTANKEAVAAIPGAIPGLVSLLGEGNASIIVQGAAAATISNLSTLPDLKLAIGATPGAAQGLVRLLASGTREAQHSAATALSNLAAGSSANKATILECPGALEGLSHLMQGGDEAAQRAAATAITNLATAITTRVRWEKELTAAGGIAGLAALANSSSTSPEVRLAAAAALRRLGRTDKLSSAACGLSPAPSMTKV